MIPMVILFDYSEKQESIRITVKEFCNTMDLLPCTNSLLSDKFSIEIRIYCTLVKNKPLF